MHGIKRTRLSPQAAEAKRLKEQVKIEHYAALQNDVMARRNANDYSREALAQTTALLDQNPEFYTIWNYRRYIFLRGLFPSSTPEEKVKLLTADLRLTTAYLHVHPKVYWIWTHRQWCLANVPLGPEGTEGWRNEFWKMELMLVEKMLDSDGRNFHAWAYRRYVLSSLPESYTPKRKARDELVYCDKKIESNFSNFSAWHSKTKILEGAWKNLSDEQVETEKDQEFEFVRQALWTDPADQSGWLFHRWLLGTDPLDRLLRREIDSIHELNEAEPDSKWCMNALAHYLLLLSETVGIESNEAHKLRLDAKALYSRLEVTDADRQGRYRDMGKSMT